MGYPDYSRPYLGGGTARRREHFAPAVPPSKFWRIALGFGWDSRPSVAEVRTAFRRHALKVHPDRGGSSESMALLNAAYEEAKRELTGVE